jgi:hypothetical protein
MLTAILNRLFGEPEQINGHERCETYLWRWTVAKWRGRGIYLHHFVGDDWSRDLHDHPKRFISIGLWGWYIEETVFLAEIGTYSAGRGIRPHGFARSPLHTFTVSWSHRKTVGPS